MKKQWEINEEFASNLAAQIEKMSSDELIILNNLYCHAVELGAQYKIYPNNEGFFEQFTPWEAIHVTKRGNYNPKQKLVNFGIYRDVEDEFGSVHSFDEMRLEFLAHPHQQIAEFIARYKSCKPILELFQPNHGFKLVEDWNCFKITKDGKKFKI